MCGRLADSLATGLAQSWVISSSCFVTLTVVSFRTALCGPIETEKAPENSHSRGLFLESWWDRWTMIVARKPHDCYW